MEAAGDVGLVLGGELGHLGLHLRREGCDQEHERGGVRGGGATHAPHTRHTRATHAPHTRPTRTELLPEPRHLLRLALQLAPQLAQLPTQLRLRRGLHLLGRDRVREARLQARLLAEERLVLPRQRRRERRPLRRVAHRVRREHAHEPQAAVGAEGHGGF
eukprot:436147-Prymnesium_polylepis.1